MHQKPSVFISPPYKKCFTSDWLLFSAHGLRLHPSTLPLHLQTIWKRASVKTWSTCKQAEDDQFTRHAETSQVVRFGEKIRLWRQTILLKVGVEPLIQFDGMKAAKREEAAQSDCDVIAGLWCRSSRQRSGSRLVFWEILRFSFKFCGLNFFSDTQQTRTRTFYTFLHLAAPAWDSPQCLLEWTSRE